MVPHRPDERDGQVLEGKSLSYRYPTADKGLSNFGSQNLTNDIHSEVDFDKDTLRHQNPDQQNDPASL